MSIQIIYKNSSPKKTSKNLILFCDYKFDINPIKEFISISEFSYIKDLLKTCDLSKNLFVFELNSQKKLVLVSIKKNKENFETESLGAELYGRINHGKNCEYLLNSDTISGQHENFLGYLLHGIKLKSYEFNKYKTKKEKRIVTINISGKKNKPSSISQIRFKALEKGTYFARDLVSEPGNILHPDEYARRLVSLRKDGLKVNL